MSLVLAYPDWPDADHVMWESVFQIVGPLDDGGALAHLRQSSRKTLRNHYGRWLKWLADTCPETLAEPPADRATVERLHSWLNALSHTKPMTRLSFVGDTVRLLSKASPDKDWRRHQQLVKRLRREAGRGDQSRKIGRVLGSHVLLEAGMRLARVVPEAGETQMEMLKRRRDGTMIAFLALIPLRCRALASLTIDDSICFLSDRIQINLTEEMTKRGVPWETTVPDCIVELMRDYRDHVRPELMRQAKITHEFFWVGSRGVPYQPNYLSKRIAGITEETTGIRITPHLFRDSAATTLSRLSPDAARLIPPVLAHSGNRTAERHYIHANSIHVGRELASVVQGLKKGRGATSR